MDIYSGAGGLSLGFESAGFVPKLAVDSDSRAIAAHSINFPTAAPVVASVAELTGAGLLKEAGLSECEVVVGGPPCGPFSLAGTQSKDDVRRELVAEFGRLVREIEPSYFVMENVPGILLPRSLQVVEEFRQAMKDGGYQCSDPWLLEASDFGVPQYRRRVFIVGAQKGLPMPRKPEPAPALPPTASEAISDLEDLEESEFGFFRSLGEPSAYAAALRIPDSDLLTGCTQVKHSATVAKRFEETTPGTAEPVSRFFRLHPDQPARTIRAGTLTTHGSHTASRPIHYSAPRCITVREAARLQSIPDWFHLDHTTWRGYMQVGNAVPPMLAQAVATSILATLKVEGAEGQAGTDARQTCCERERHETILRGHASPGHQC